MREKDERTRCPVCGVGVFTEVEYEDPTPGGPEPRLAGDSYEILLFSCGHEVRGAPLAEADPDRMTVEQRQSRDTADPMEPETSEPATERTAEPEEER
ncbi:MAG TPA: hypothetical protein VLE71_05515 [Actinomycetota bacterium]|nr:hypothetical protein [Actinomycetota bacterium]